MRYIIFYIIGIMFVLSGCSKVKGQIKLKNQSATNIFAKPIISTGTIEAYQDDPYFAELSTHTGCLVDQSGMAEGVNRVFCESIIGYDHLYKIPLLNLEYIYDSDNLVNYASGGIDRFLTKDRGGLPMALSGNDILYWLNNNQKSYIIKKSNPLNLTSEEIINNLDLQNGCNIQKVSSGNLSFGADIIYNISVNVVDNDGNLIYGKYCLPDLPLDGGNSTRTYIFSSKNKNYYYVIGDDGGGSGPKIYTNKSLKLFIE